MIHLCVKQTVTDDNEVRGFSLVELSLVIVVLAIVVAALWSSFRQRDTVPTGIQCLNNLKQVGLSFRVFANDHDGKLPTQLPLRNAGPAGSRTFAQPVCYFLVATGELSTPTILTCPADTRLRVRDWQTLSNENLSYFLSLNAELTMSNTIMAGDRNLVVWGRPVDPGFLDLTTNMPISWSGMMHSKSFGAPCGNLLFTDGSVETVKAHLMARTWTARRYGPDASVIYVQEDFPRVVRNQDLLTNRLSIP